MCSALLTYKSILFNIGFFSLTSENPSSLADLEANLARTMNHLAQNAKDLEVIKLKLLNPRVYSRERARCHPHSNLLRFSHSYFEKGIYSMMLINSTAVYSSLMEILICQLP